jgi:hypothetical protein
MALKRKSALLIALILSLFLALFFEFQIFELTSLDYAFYWHIGVAFYFFVLMFVMGIYAPSLFRVERDYKMQNKLMALKRAMHYMLHYFVLPTFLYFSTLAVLFCISSLWLQQGFIFLSSFAFFAILICVMKVVRCAPKGYTIPDSKKVLYYYICRLKFCFFYKLYVAFLTLLSLYLLSIEHVIPTFLLPILSGVSVYILLTHNMLFTVSWAWDIQKRALLIAFIMALITFITRFGRIHFIIAGIAFITFYHIFEGFLFHKISGLKKEILQKYMLMGAIAIMLIWAGFDMDFAGKVQLPDENFAHINLKPVVQNGQIGLSFIMTALVISFIFLSIYFLYFKRVIKQKINLPNINPIHSPTQKDSNNSKSRLFIFKK